MAEGLRLCYTITDVDANEIATTLRYTNQFSYHKHLRRHAVEAFGSMLTANQEHRFLTMSLFPAIIDPAPVAENAEDPPVAKGESYCISDMVSEGSANYEALQERLASAIEMMEILMGVYEGEQALKEGKGKRVGNAIEIDE